MDEKDQQIAHFRIVARNLKLAEFRPNQQFAMDKPEFEFILQSWDTANKSAEINNYSVCTTWGVTEKGHMFLLHVYRARLEYPDLKRAVVRQAEIHQAKTVVIEDKASGTQLLQDLKHDEFSLVTAYESKGDKVMRMSTVTPTIENGLVHLPKEAEWLESYLYELAVFPNGKYDDQVDSTSQALGWMRDCHGRCGFGVFEYYKREWERMNALASAPVVQKPDRCPRCESTCIILISRTWHCNQCGLQGDPPRQELGISRRDALLLKR